MSFLTQKLIWKKKKNCFIADENIKRPSVHNKNHATTKKKCLISDDCGLRRSPGVIHKTLSGEKRHLYRGVSFFKKTVFYEAAPSQSRVGPPCFFCGLTILQLCSFCDTMNPQERWLHCS